jgi:hypothetical protein
MEPAIAILRERKKSGNQGLFLRPEVSGILPQFNHQGPTPCKEPYMVQSRGLMQFWEDYYAAAAFAAVALAW